MHQLTKALIVATFVGAPAVAAEPIDVVADANAVKAVIYHGDLDVRSNDGHAALKNRVSYAARTICLTPGLKPLRHWRSERDCFQTARADGYAQADALFSAPRGSVIVQTITISAR